MTETTWYCDVCDTPVTNPGLAMVAWDQDAEGRLTGFRIIHKGTCDLGLADSWIELRNGISEDGSAQLLALLSPGPLKEGVNAPPIKDLNEFVDLYRRLRTPGYEEARRYFKTAAVQEWAAEATEVLPYTKYGLNRIIEIGRAST